MSTKLIARERECQELQAKMESDESEFIVICGRRRIGKTFLVEEFFQHKFDFKYVGAHGLSTRSQLKNFGRALKEYSRKPQENFKDWSDAFYALKEYLTNLSDEKRKVIFIDEMPWMDSKRSDFVKSLEYFWNSWAAAQGNIVLIATGSATSWMSNKLFKNRGGLHNRVTSRIFLRPFTLHETEVFLKKKRFAWDRYQILQCYMAFGGIPYYLKQLNPTESVAQNIDRFCFDPEGMFRTEFDELYNALFASADTYIKVVKALAQHREGLTNAEISKITKINGRNLTRVLKNLEQCDFIARRAQFGHKKRGTIYRLIDFYTLFYFRFIENDLTLDPHWWTGNMSSGEVLAWNGWTFELICLEHHSQIKQALGISGVSTTISTWRFVPVKDDGRIGAQVDMVITRADRLIHLVEIKFHKGQYSITSRYDEEIRQRVQTFIEETDQKYGVVVTFITTYGLKNPTSYGIVHSEVTMDDLFKT
ncbi:MAG: ATP-binding protein [Bacteroidales bacterium]|nr:ATP-binding protein [Bacteroidales bacterium]